jgi:hypothetical protein
MKPLAERRALRYWRVHFSLFFVALLVATLVMWVRSYRWDEIGWRRTDSSFVQITSQLGEVDFEIYGLPLGKATSDLSWGTDSLPVTKQMREAVHLERTMHNSFLGFSCGQKMGSIPYYVVIPYWFPTAFFPMLAGLPRYGPYIRFGLRTLLILFTIVAALLGYVVWALHSTVAG